ncbi:MAG: glycosyltransferase family 9 protein, partial [Armatimonadetes bacterium]|nr:glycosyltransferase family 9 protein [Armatimonadota bacterium]
MTTPLRAARAAHSRLTSAKRIAVVAKFGYMGDTIVATPFLHRLRLAAPDAHIDLITSKSGAVAVKNCPWIDRALAVEKGRSSRMGENRALLRALRSPTCDVVFLLNRSFRSAAMAVLAGARLRVGFDNEHRKILLSLPVPYLFDRNELDCHLDLLRSLGVDCEPELPSIWVTDGEREAARSVLRRPGTEALMPDAFVLGMQPGSNDPAVRAWGVPRYAEAADTIAADLGARVVLLGGAAERQTADQVERAMKTGCINMVGELSLRESLALIGVCTGWIGNDTGLLHAAVAHRVPSVGIFGPTKVVRWGYNTVKHRSVAVFNGGAAASDIRECLNAIPVA